MNEAMLLWGIGLIAAALLLVFVEVFVPSGGLIAVVAAILAIAGVVCLFRVSMALGAVGSLAVLILAPTAGFFALSVLPSTPLGRKLIYGDSPPHDEPQEPVEDPLAALVGQEGVALTDMRPIGAIRVGSERHQALSEVSYVRAGTRIRVTTVEGSQIKVRPLA
ncbi:MAG: hypothetical protein KF745_01400 [Phycisphaeraceae bacterium]|nr:hypothetical protein [Phycisphaeraceae bacterium]